MGRNYLPPYEQYLARLTSVSYDQSQEMIEWLKNRKPDEKTKCIDTTVVDGEIVLNVRTSVRIH